MAEPVRTKYRVGGMDCAACASKIETAVSRIPGVSEVGASFTVGTLNVVHDGVPFATIERAIRPLGYSVQPAGADAAELPLQHDQGGGHFEIADSPWWKTSKAMLTLASAIALVAAYLIGRMLPEIGHWAFLAALLVGLVPVARRAVAGAGAGTPFSIETLMTIAAMGAVIIGATEEAATVVMLFLIGELLEGVAASRARASIKGLADLVPKTALLVEGDKTSEVPASSLALNAIILVRPGDRIPADGDIVEGRSAIDESPVTGESVPRTKQVGEPVFAGTINTDAVLKIKVTKTATDNTIARVVRLVEEAQESKAPTARFIDRFSTYYTPGVLLVGALVALVPPLILGQTWSEWVYRGLAILLIGCPCALVISTPAAIAAALSAGARRGLLLKGGAVLESMRYITVVALDKTGTLTKGKSQVTDIIGVSRSEGRVLSLAAALETGSSHPLAMAILARAKADKVPVPPAAAAKAVAGKGVSGRVGGEDVFLGSPAAAADRATISQEVQAAIDGFNSAGKTVSVLTVGAEIAAIFAIRDEPRDDALAGIQALKALGIGVVMLTGDNERTARAIGSALGIEVRAGLLPQDKQRIVRELQSKGEHVAKVGDGINDAPALAAADIGIAMGGGTDVALETADAAILHGRVVDIAGMIELSKATMDNIWQNIGVSLGLKVVFFVTTIIGVTGLWPAILADTGATVLVTLNAMRLLAWRPRTRSVCSPEGGSAGSPD